MVILKMSEAELHDLWDRIEAQMGPMRLGDPLPSDYLRRAYRRELLTWDQAVELCMAATGIGTTDP